LARSAPLPEFGFSLSLSFSSSSSSSLDCSQQNKHKGFLRAVLTIKVSSGTVEETKFLGANTFYNLTTFINRLEEKSLFKAHYTES